MNPQPKRENLEKLLQEQKQITRLWRDLVEERLKHYENLRGVQRFSMNDAAKIKQWKEAMRCGETDIGRRQLQESKRQAEALAKQSEGLEQEKRADAMSEQPVRNGCPTRFCEHSNRSSWRNRTVGSSRRWRRSRVA
jgi:hypothetical protein